MELTAKRMGDYLEFFGDDARTAATALGLTLTTARASMEPCPASRNHTPMAGFPHFRGDLVAKLEADGFTLTID